MQSRHSLLCLLSLTAALAPGVAQAQDLEVNTNDYGMSGLMQLPSARAYEDGELRVGASFVHPYNRYYFTVQGTPWFQGLFRYTRIDNRAFSPSNDEENFADKSFDLKIRLVEESENFPDISIGLQDIGGTGLFSAEYLVATRRFYDVDATVGIGWGQLAEKGGFRNPLRAFGSVFESRSDDVQTGEISGAYFRGREAALFGGLDYRTPVKGLHALLEYDPNDYGIEPLGQSLDSSSQINFGLVYDLGLWGRASLGVQRGDQVALGWTFGVNMNALSGVPNEYVPAPVVPVRDPDMPAASGSSSAPAAAESRFSEASGLSTGQYFLDRFDALGLRTDSIVLQGESFVVDLSRDSVVPAAVELGHLAKAIYGSPEMPEVSTVVFRHQDRRPLVLDRESVHRSMSVTGQPVAFVADVARWDAAQDSLVPQAARPVAGLPEPFDLSEVADRVDAELSGQDITGRAFSIEGSTASVFIEPGTYRNRYMLISRAARAVARHAPGQVEEIAVTIVARGLPVHTAVLPRSVLERYQLGVGSVDETRLALTQEQPYAIPDNVVDWYAPEDRFSWSIRPRLRQNIGSGQNFYAYQIWAEIEADYELTPKLNVEASYGVGVYDTFDELSREPASQLPNVRSLIVSYLQEAPTWLERLAVTYNDRLFGDVYGRVSAGIFELMYAGAGAEILYRPTGRSFAIGVDINRVRQRDFQGRFRLRDYRATTGHLNYYQSLPFYDLDLEVNVGRYLAGDEGATFSLARTFDSGMRIGAFATFTDVPAEEFGEGSFDKGVFVSIPLDIFVFKPTATSFSTSWRPLTRDGGQKVIVPGRLIGAVGSGRLQGEWSEFYR